MEARSNRRARASSTLDLGAARSRVRGVLPELVSRRIGVLAMKTLADGLILRSKTATALECLHYAMSLPTSVVITGIDSMPILEQALEAARTFRPMSQHEIDALLARTREAGAHGDYELFKTSAVYDTTAQHPDWLGKVGGPELLPRGP